MYDSSSVKNSDFASQDGSHMDENFSDYSRNFGPAQRHVFQLKNHKKSGEQASIIVSIRLANHIVDLMVFAEDSIEKLVSEFCI